jgi:hypothetical protein
MGLKVNNSDDEAKRIAIRSCLLKIFAAGGIAFAVLAQGVENLVRYLYFPGSVWVIGGTVLAGWWAYETYCIGDPPT